MRVHCLLDLGASGDVPAQDRQAGSGDLNSTAARRLHAGPPEAGYDGNLLIHVLEPLLDCCVAGSHPSTVREPAWPGTDRTPWPYLPAVSVRLTGRDSP